MKKSDIKVGKYYLWRLSHYPPDEFRNGIITGNTCYGMCIEKREEGGWQNLIMKLPPNMSGHNCGDKFSEAKYWYVADTQVIREMTDMEAGSKIMIEDL